MRKGGNITITTGNNMLKTIITNLKALKIPIKTKNFHPDTDIKLCCTCGHNDCHNPSIKQWALNKVQLIRDDANRPLKVTSAGRCKYHPNEVTKNKPGDHGNLVGIDIAYNGELERNELILLAGRYGATTIAVGNGFIHMGWRKLPNGDRRVRTWSYS